MIYSLYSLTFPNNKQYIGITSKSPAARFRGHTYHASRGAQSPLLSAIRKYGAQSVVVSTLAIGHRDYIAELEVRAIAVLKTQQRKYGYNVADGGQLSPMHNAEVAAKVSKSKMGHSCSQETRDKIGAAHLGRKLTIEHRAKLKLACERRRLSGYKKTVTDETRQKIRETLTGRRHSDETKQKISAGLNRFYGNTADGLQDRPQGVLGSDYN